jgi:hypothetical protein
MKRLLLSALVVFVQFWLGTGKVIAATATVTSFSVSSNSVGEYLKFEATFTISKTYPADSFLPYYYYDPSDTPTAYPGRNSPYGVDGITINAVFTSPSGKELTVPAFYYQDYVRSGTTSKETMTPTSTYDWKIRFAPQEIGTYTYYLTIQDKDGTTKYPTSGNLTLTSVGSNSKGFVRASSIDSRFLSFSNGQSFIPLASGHQWWKCCGARSFDYETTFNAWKGSGINLTRIWDQNDGYGLTIEGHYDQYSFPGDYNPIDNGVDISTLPKGTQINQRGAYEQDKIIESAEKNGVYIELCSHGDAYWIWDASVYDESWNPNPRNMYDPEHINYWERNFRYRVARWGYSTSILTWETWNEHGHIVPGSDAYNFYQTYGEYQQTTDPYHHLRTTSQGSQAMSPAFWSSPAMDLANYHDYMMPGRYSSALVNDSAFFVSSFAWCLAGHVGCSSLGVGDNTSWSGNPKPWIWGEIDVGTSSWNVEEPKVKDGDARIRLLHNSTWAGLFTPIGTSPIDWFWDQEAQSQTNTDRLADRKVTSQFFRGVDYAGGQFTFLMSAGDKPSGYNGETIGVDQSQARVYGMRRADQKAAYLWVQNKGYTWYNSPSIPSAISPNVTIGGLLNKSYVVEIWNTHPAPNQILSIQTLTPTNGILTINVSNLTSDVAIQIDSQKRLVFLPFMLN